MTIRKVSGFTRPEPEGPNLEDVLDEVTSVRQQLQALENQLMKIAKDVGEIKETLSEIQSMGEQ